MPETPTTLLEPESERDLWLQQRRRAMVLVAFCFAGWLALLSFLMIHPSGPDSPARHVKNTLFGRRLAEAVESAVASGGGSSSERSGQGQRGQAGSGGRSGQTGRDGQGTQGRAGAGQQGGSGQGQAGQGRAGQGQSGRAGQGDQGGAPGDEAGGQDAMDQADGEGSESANGGHRGSGTRRRPGSNAPANPQHPENNPSELPAPPERSIGWLDRFFGVPHTEVTSLEAGEGGTGTAPEGAGNTNVSAAPAANPVAAEFTQDAAPTTRVELARAPQPPRTNLPAIAATNATLSDPMEQLLNQHRAGRGALRISLMWENKNDLDLHVVDPNGEEIYYSHRTARSGGLLDIDMNASPPLVSPAVENVYWPERGAPLGAYKIYVNHFRKHDRVDETAFTVRLLIKGHTTDFHGVVQFGRPKKLVHQFSLALPARPAN